MLICSKFFIVLLSIYSFGFYALDRQQCGEGPSRPLVTNISEDLSPSRGESLLNDKPSSFCNRLDFCSEVKLEDAKFFC